MVTRERSMGSFVMSGPFPIRLLVTAVLALAMPGIACFAWYSLDHVSGMNSIVRVMVALAYPTAMIAITLLVLTASSAKRSVWRVGACALVATVAISVVVLARAGLLSV
jgi:hypothetical protein